MALFIGCGTAASSWQWGQGGPWAHANPDAQASPANHSLSICLAGWTPDLWNHAAGTLTAIERADAIAFLPFTSAYTVQQPWTVGRGAVSEPSHALPIPHPFVQLRTGASYSNLPLITSTVISTPCLSTLLDILRAQDFRFAGNIGKETALYLSTIIA